MEEKNNTVYFYTAPYYELDSFSAHSVSLWGKDFPTAEHAYQWKKFDGINDVVAVEILLAKSPYAVKQISGNHKESRVPNWGEKKVEVMKEILLAKVMQHEDVKMTLLKTGKCLIVENSPVDDFWGIGREGNGKNILGNLWVEVRDELV